ncbi:unnamed protein product [Sympodiomycopsis kandeliae]
MGPEYAAIPVFLWRGLHDPNKIDIYAIFRCQPGNQDPFSIKLCPTGDDDELLPLWKGEQLATLPAKFHDAMVAYFQITTTHFSDKGARFAAVRAIVVREAKASEVGALVRNVALSNNGKKDTEIGDVGPSTCDLVALPFLGWHNKGRFLWRAIESTQSRVGEGNFNQKLHEREPLPLRRVPSGLKQQLGTSAISLQTINHRLVAAKGNLSYYFDNEKNVQEVVDRAEELQGLLSQYDSIEEAASHVLPRAQVSPLPTRNSKLMKKYEAIASEFIEGTYEAGVEWREFNERTVTMPAGAIKKLGLGPYKYRADLKVWTVFARLATAGAKEVELL